MKALFVVLCASLVLSGCATKTANLIPVGGSRADGTVKLAYEYQKGDAPKVNYLLGLESAKARCAAWGYTGAEAFGGQTKTCADIMSGRCEIMRVTFEYQCTGNPVPHI